jgi:ankyrin repeat protein
MTVQLTLEQLLREAKELVRAGQAGKLSHAQLQLAREHGFESWQKLEEYVDGLAVQRPFRTDWQYFEDRADGIASTRALTAGEARLQLANRHGFSSWRGLRKHVDALRTGVEPATPFMHAYEAVEGNDRGRLAELLDRYPDLVRQRGTNGNDLLGLAGDLDVVRLLLGRGADPNRGNDYGWTKLHQAGYSNRPALADVLLAAGARTDLSARGDGGTPLIAALFWGHRDVVELLGLEPGNLRVAAGLGRLDLIRELHRTREGGAHRAFYRPHSGFPPWQPVDDPVEVLDEALIWAAKADRVEAIELLAELGARADTDLYRGTALHWAAACGHVDTIWKLVGLGVDPNRTGTFGGPTHGEGVTPLHLAAQAGHRAAVEALLQAGADPAIRDRLYDGPTWGWAEHSGNDEIAALLREAAGAPGPSAR